MSCTRYESIWGSGGIAPFILNRCATPICQHHASPARRASPVAISSQPSYECHVSETNANTQCFRVFYYCRHMALTAAQLPTHETEYSVVESEWCDRNHKLTWTVQEGTKNSPETLHRNWHCSVDREGSRVASSGANILARGRAETCVEFPTYIYTAQGKYSYSKAGLKIWNGRSRKELRSSGLLSSEQW
jgi:hypothetical protein